MLYWIDIETPHLLSSKTAFWVELFGNKQYCMPYKTHKV